MDNVLEAGIARISQGHWPGFRAAGCNISIVIAVHDQRPIFGRTWVFLTDTPTDTYRYLSYIVSCSLKDMPHTLTNLIQFHLAISGRGSLPMNCWMFHLFHTSGWASTARAQRKSKQAYANYASTCWKHPRKGLSWKLARKAKPGQARENTRPASSPGLTRDQHSTTMEQPLNLDHFK